MKIWDKITDVPVGQLVSDKDWDYWVRTGTEAKIWITLEHTWFYFKPEDGIDTFGPFSESVLTEDEIDEGYENLQYGPLG